MTKFKKDSQICVICSSTLPLSSFYKGSNKLGLDNRCKSCEKNRRKVNYKENFERETYFRVRNRSLARGIPFNLRVSDIPKVPAKCPVLGINLEINWGNKAQSENSPTLDRIDNRKGYETGNVAWISAKANTLKNANTFDTIIHILRYMLCQNTQ